MLAAHLAPLPTGRSAHHRAAKSPGFLAPGAPPLERPPTSSQGMRPLRGISLSYCRENKRPRTRSGAKLISTPVCGWRAPELGRIFRWLKALYETQPRDDIWPTDVAPIIRANEGGAELIQLRWGFPPGRRKGPSVIGLVLYRWPLAPGRGEGFCLHDADMRTWDLMSRPFTIDNSWYSIAANGQLGWTLIVLHSETKRRSK
jgi:hypothetical protein